jgi:hypothetical protein
MASSKNKGVWTPFQDVTDSNNSGKYNTDSYLLRPCRSHVFFSFTGQTLDPKELKRQKDRERYARKKDEILKKRRESRELKKVTCATQNGLHTPSNTPHVISTGTSIHILHTITNMTMHRSDKI